MTHMRLFIAIQLNEAMRQLATIVQDTFRQFGVRGNFTPTENLHLTLAFIGEYGDPDEVLDAMERISFAPFTITMDKVGSFDELWWTGFEESGELETLVRKVRRALADAVLQPSTTKGHPNAKSCSTACRVNLYTTSNDR